MKIRWTMAPASRRAVVPLSLVTFGALLFAACGGGDSNGAKSTTAPPAKTAAATAPAAAASPASTSQSQASTDLDACTLLTKAEVEAATGKTVSEPNPEALANLATCGFEDTAPPNLSAVDVSVLSGIRDGDAKEVFDMAKKNGNDPQAISGLGDDAFWDDVLHSLNVLKDNYLVSIDVGPLENGDRQEVAKTLAGKALGRLP